MNPVQAVETPQLYGHSMHAGGWPKLGWQQADASHDSDEIDASDEAPGGLFS